MIYSVSKELYAQLSDRLLEAIEERSYFSGAIECEGRDGVACRLVCSCVIYRERLCMPEGEGSRICSIIPVWWEFHTTSKAGRLDNDFSFRELNLENL
uniref:hypothetical protein n=1 Tax=Alistipes sp. TaxID=1872444 RepID=UPI004055C51F